MNEHHCCFTGHRKLSKAVLNALPEILDRRVNGLYSEGIHTFYAGGALGFDTLAAEAVIRFPSDFGSPLQKSDAPLETGGA